ncbi:MAG: cardiolipin synthase [Taibaiella sp.]|nr:cardiolipin synthase [Taibaiella sp.]
MSNQTNWTLLIQILYMLIVVLVCIRIIIDTSNISKSLAYLLLTVFVPVLGMVFYFSFGINYRKRKMYNKKLKIDMHLRRAYFEKLRLLRERLATTDNVALLQNKELIQLLSNKRVGSEPILPNYKVELLVNGEAFFPKLKEELLKARHHIHIEFYIFEDDTVGNEIKEILIQKAYSGVEVRFIYDDFGSMSIRHSFVDDMIVHGVQAFPFKKIKLVSLANRLNYRNHRKIVVIDGEVSFVGGINISDKYSNDFAHRLYWRDTHLMVKGYSAQGLQRVFLSDWNFCSREDISITKEYFPEIEFRSESYKFLQIVSSGPDSDLPNILYSILQAINLAQNEILITTPYYIPDISLQEMLKIAALSGLDVKLLVPYKGDSKLVDLASRSFYSELLRAGVRVFQYKKGFIHAKTFVTDRKLASVGTANLDSRSFDLNFEVAALIYDQEIAEQLAVQFYLDLKESEELLLSDWEKRSGWTRFSESLIRLISPFM